MLHLLSDLPMGSQHVGCLQRSHISIQHSSFIRRKTSSRVEGKHHYHNLHHSLEYKTLSNMYFARRVVGCARHRGSSRRQWQFPFSRATSLEDGLSLKIKILHIHLFSIATRFLWNNALVEYIDNWTRSYRLVIIYRNRPKLIFNGSVIKYF